MKKEKYKYKIFGRMKGRKIKYSSTINEFNKFSFDYNNDVNLIKHNILDIGSGSGENTVYLAITHPKSQIIACEIFEDGNINLLNNIILNKIDNIRLYQGNVLEFLDNLEKNFFFNEIWILFPDPWPKNRHQKRRLLNKEFLNKIHLCLKNSGKLFIATDSSSYLHHIMKLIYEFKTLYYWKNQRFDEWNYEYLNLPKTKFYKKSLKSNRKSILFELIKI